MSSEKLDSTALLTERPAGNRPSSPRAQALALRLERGARALAALAAGLSNDQWNLRLPGDGRAVGVIVHHVASVYPIEIELAQKLAAGQPIIGVTAADIDAMNAGHARQHADVGREEALDLLRRNSSAAAAAIRELTDEQLDGAAEASLYANAPVTCQFMLEDHAVRHSYHHCARITRLLTASAGGGSR